jgi:putative transposase-like DNA-binding protein
MDRQRRANNPDCFDSADRALKGKRPCRTSRRMRSTRQDSADLQRRLAAHRKCLHGAMSNEIVRAAARVQTETIDYRAFQRAFGRSIGMRAPGMFIAGLAAKLEARGGELIELDTRTLCLSQVCHGCGSLVKKPLSQRRHECEYGVSANRDQYSALLAACVEGNHVDVDQVEHAWSRLLTDSRTTSTGSTHPALVAQSTGSHLDRPLTECERSRDAHAGMRPLGAIWRRESERSHPTARRQAPRDSPSRRGDQHIARRVVRVGGALRGARKVQHIARRVVRAFRSATLPDRERGGDQQIARRVVREPSKPTAVSSRGDQQIARRVV